MANKILTVKRLRELLKGLPDDSEVYVRHGMAYDDAYPAKVRAFGAGPTVYIEIDMGNRHEHRNFPEGYVGATEIKLPIKKK